MTADCLWPESPRLLALWSAPRSRSTAFARMMIERGDFAVLHEPFSHLMDFGASDVGGRVAHTEPELMTALTELAAAGPVFFKDTTDFRYPALLTDAGFLTGPTHTFIIRHPAQAIASHLVLNPQLRRDEIGFAWLAEIYDAVATATGLPPVVVDSDDLIERPASTVRAYCDAVGIPFLPAALSWSPGMPADWQRTSRWHESTSQTSGFTATPAPSAPSLDASPALAAHLAYHLPYYERLHAAALRP